MATVTNITYGTWAELTLTNLASLANDATDPFTAWQSARIDNQTATKADDFEIVMHLATAATAPANDQALYVYLVPWVYDGSTWYEGANFGTTTLPTGSEGTASISDPNGMKGPIGVPYKITSQVLSKWFTVGSLCDGIVPDGWSLAIRNCTGAALLDDSPGTELVIAYRPITYTLT